MQLIELILRRLFIKEKKQKKQKKQKRKNQKFEKYNQFSFELENLIFKHNFNIPITV